MASLDLFGNPVKGDTHSAFFNKLTGQGSGVKLTAKQQFALEANKLKQSKAELKYKQKLEAVKDANLRFQVAQARNQIRHPQVIEKAKTKISILQGFFK
jgi:hypothetical protein